MTEPLRVVVHLTSDIFQDVDDMPFYEDDAHVFYPALHHDEDWRDTSYAELGQAIEADEVNPRVRHWYVLNRPESDAHARLRAIVAYHES